MSVINPYTYSVLITYMHTNAYTTHVIMTDVCDQYVDTR